MYRYHVLGSVCLFVSRNHSKLLASNNRPHSNISNDNKIIFWTKSGDYDIYHDAGFRFAILQYCEQGDELQFQKSIFFKNCFSIRTHYKHTTICLQFEVLPPCGGYVVGRVWSSFSTTLRIYSLKINTCVFDNPCSTTKHNIVILKCI